ncbi:MAG TPA: glycosyltransferase family 2 protein [Synergistaceae bacterium]|jgi:cellulose synthase/poly-beta-1,6-N-acetylglucosamine synthase-like glycosyltransferase|nr:glycosyltransferase family 2 protein [Synergistaceae bacterium]HQH78529.1 glycosyltransferase family 2 protein [Synergistaceae bacterium]HQK25294.1 glycosyltransferase family 2 protein [Synergistaceae bacterium]
MEGVTGSAAFTLWDMAAFMVALAVLFLALDGIYQIAVSIFGWGRFTDSPRAQGRLNFFVLVPAHNEARVIGPLLDSLQNQDYPRERFEVCVSCDNCQDATAEVASRYGVRVLVRTTEVRSGKTENVRWALEQVPLEHSDAIVVIDADNLAERDFLSRMNDYLEAHPDADAVQGLLDVKNPRDNWLARSYAMAYWYTNRFWQRARGNLTLSATLGGTGLAVRTPLFLQMLAFVGSLTEDLEMATMVVLSGKRVHWNEHAVIYDEKPTDLGVSFSQRVRWMQGHFWVFGHYGPTVLRRFFSTGRLRYLDLFLYLAAPAKATLSFLCLVGCALLVTFRPEATWAHPWVQPIAHLGLGWGALPISLGMVFVYGFFVAVVGPSLRHRRLDLSYFFYAPAYLWFGLTWLPVLFKALFLAYDQGTWVKTEHTRHIVLGDLARLAGRSPASPALAPKEEPLRVRP